MRHRYFHDNSVTVNFPDKINVTEVKAPTDESIRLMEEMHEKVLNNVIQKVKIENNLISGEAVAFSLPHTSTLINDEIRLVFKFKINGQEFVVEKDVDQRQLWHDSEMRDSVQGIESALPANCLHNFANAIMLWFAIKKLPEILFEQITKTKVPEYLSENRKIKI